MRAVGRIVVHEEEGNHPASQSVPTTRATHIQTGGGVPIGAGAGGRTTAPRPHGPIWAAGHRQGLHPLAGRRQRRPWCLKWPRRVCRGHSALVVVGAECVRRAEAMTMTLRPFEVQFDEARRRTGSSSTYILRWLLLLVRELLHGFPGRAARRPVQPGVTGHGGLRSQHLCSHYPGEFRDTTADAARACPCPFFVQGSVCLGLHCHSHLPERAHRPTCWLWGWP